MTSKWNEQGYTDWVDGNVLAKADLEDTLRAGCVPIGSVVSWLKTFGQVDTGTNDSTGTNLLVDSTATFVTDGVGQKMIVYNYTDGTWSYVSSVDSETQLTLNDDIFTATGKTYYVYAVPALPSGFVECNGQTLSDANSPFNGMVIPNLNGDNRFLKGDSTSGTTTTGTHNHQIFVGSYNSSTDKYIAAGGDSSASTSSAGKGYNSSGTQVSFTYDGSATPAPLTGSYYTSKDLAEPKSYTVVWIMRVK